MKKKKQKKKKDMIFSLEKSNHKSYLRSNEGEDLLPFFHCGEDGSIRCKLQVLKEMAEKLNFASSGSKEMICMRILKKIAKELNIDVSGERIVLYNRIIHKLEANNRLKKPPATTATTTTKTLATTTTAITDTTISSPKTTKRKSNNFRIENLVIYWNERTYDFSSPCDKKEIRKKNIFINDLKTLITLLQITHKMKHVPKKVENYCDVIRNHLLELIPRQEPPSATVPVNPLPSTTTISQEPPELVDENNQIEKLSREKLTKQLKDEIKKCFEQFSLSITGNEYDELKEKYEKIISNAPPVITKTTTSYQQPPISKHTPSISPSVSVLSLPKQVKRNGKQLSWNKKEYDFGLGCDKKRLRKENILLNDLKDLVKLLSLSMKGFSKTIESYCHVVTAYLQQSSSPVIPSSPPPPLSRPSPVIPPPPSPVIPPTPSDKTLSAKQTFKNYILDKIRNTKLEYILSSNQKERLISIIWNVISSIPSAHKRFALEKVIFYTLQFIIENVSMENLCTGSNRTTKLHNFLIRNDYMGDLDPSLPCSILLTLFFFELLQKNDIHVSISFEKTNKLKRELQRFFHELYAKYENKMPPIQQEPSSSLSPSSLQFPSSTPPPHLGAGKTSSLVGTGQTPSPLGSREGGQLPSQSERRKSKQIPSELSPSQQTPSTKSSKAPPKQTSSSSSSSLSKLPTQLTSPGRRGQKPNQTPLETPPTPMSLISQEQNLVMEPTHIKQEIKRCLNKK